jgi:hypothetical protein
MQGGSARSPGCRAQPSPARINMRGVLTMSMLRGWRCEPWAWKGVGHAGRSSTNFFWPFGGHNSLKTGERPGRPRLSSTPFFLCHSRRSAPWEGALFLVVAVLPVSGSRRRLVSDAIYSILLWSLHGGGLVLLLWICRFRFVCHGYSLLFTAYPKAYAR